MLRVTEFLQLTKQQLDYFLEPQFVLLTDRDDTPAKCALNRVHCISANISYSCEHNNSLLNLHYQQYSIETVRNE